MITIDLLVYHTAEKLPTREATDWTHKWSFNSMKRNETFMLPFTTTGPKPNDWIPYIEEHVSQFTDHVVKVVYVGPDQQSADIKLEPLQFRLFPNTVQVHHFKITTTFNEHGGMSSPL